MDTPLANQLIEAFFNSVDAGLAVLERHPDALHARTGLGETPLHYLAVEGQLDAVRCLAERGAAVDTVSDVGGTPLAEAASLGHADLVRFLLDAGATLDLPGQHEPTLHEGIASGSAQIVRLLVDHGGDIHRPGPLQRTALHIAADEDERGAVLDCLIELGADVDARDGFAWTPLHIAAFYGAEANVGRLLRAGADPRCLDSQGQTAADLARTKGHADIAARLEQRTPH